MFPRPSSSGSSELPRSRVTVRAVLIGFFLAAFICIWVPYNGYVLNASPMDFEHLSVGLMIPFFFIVVVVNGCLRKIAPRYVLTTPELIVILSIGLIASTIPSNAFMGYFIATISTPYYFASPENQWAAVFFQYLPPWLVAENDGREMQWFFEGMPSRAFIPWGAWVMPLIWWGMFFVVLFFVGACVMVILRKQWIEHEKLTFPLAQVLLQVVDQPETRAFFPRFMQGRMFWVGFSLPVFIIGWNIVNYFTEFAPIPIGQRYNMPLLIGQVFPAINIKLNIYLLCFAFFSPVDVLFSIWFFHLLSVLETGGMNAVGLVETGASPVAAVVAQEIGGLIVFVLWGFWMARGHLRNVWRKATGRADHIDDTGEFFSYRAAVFGIVFGVFYIACWLHAAGMQFGIMIPFLVLLFIFYIGVARIVAETGIAALDLPMNSHEFLVRTVGSSRIDPGSLTIFGLCNTFARNWRTFTMVSVSHILKFGDRAWSSRQRLFALICVTFAVSLILSAIYTIYTGYETVGAYHFGQWAFGVGNIAFFENVKVWINNPTQLSQLELIWFILGGVVMSVLLALRYRFPGWPVHPIGFTIARGVAINGAFFTIFVAWLVKTIILKTGGIGLYQRSQSFFLGMLVGFATGMTASIVVDIIWFPGQGHGLHGW